MSEANHMKDAPFLEAFHQGRSARRKGLLKSSNPYLSHPNLHHLKRTWEGGWELEAQGEGCMVSSVIESKQLAAVETPLLAHIYRFVQHLTELDEDNFLKAFQSLSVSYLPGRKVRITVILPNNDQSQARG